MTDTDPTELADALAGRRIAVPESRALDLFADMLERRGATVLRAPLVAIHDAPDAAPVEAWLREFADGGCDDLILLTGEGLRRLLGFAERAGGGLRDRFVARLGEVRTLTRGPKPARALRDLDLRPTLTAAAPTTDGVIETLAAEDLTGRRVGVQLYGTDPNDKLVGWLRGAGAEASTVAPYIYADDAEDEQVAALIDTLADGGVDAIAFTSSPQVRRLFQVAGRRECENRLRAGLAATMVAAVGPIIRDALTERGIRVDLMPESSYFMKPLVNALARQLGPCR